MIFIIKVRSKAQTSEGSVSLDFYRVMTADFPTQNRQRGTCPAPKEPKGPAKAFAMAGAAMNSMPRWVLSSPRAKPARATASAA